MTVYPFQKQIEAKATGSPFHFRMSGMAYHEHDEFGVYPKKEKPRGPIAVMAFAVSMSFIAGFIFRGLAGV